MRKLLFLLFLSMSVFVCITGNAMALNLGQNITIKDLVGTGTGWYGEQEDQEVEPGMVNEQQWDLEGFFLDGTSLTMVGGFNFQTGIGYWLPGDILIEVTGDAKYGLANTGSGSGESIVNNSFGYEYALTNFNYTTKKFDVVNLNNSSMVTVFYTQNEESNPWKYNLGGTPIGASHTFDYYSGLGDLEVGGLQGGSHNALVVDLSFLESDINNFTVHYTMRCGNDNLMGQVPEPATILLSGIGLLGIGFVMRRRLIK